MIFANTACGMPHEPGAVARWCVTSARQTRGPPGADDTRYMTKW